MSKKKLIRHANINDVVNETIFQFPSVKFKTKIEDRCKDVGINLRELSNLTGIRYASISNLKNAKVASLNLQHIMAIMVALRIDSFDELFTIDFEDGEDSEKFAIEKEYYKNKGLPDSALNKIKENRDRLGR